MLAAAATTLAAYAQGADEAPATRPTTDVATPDGRKAILDARRRAATRRAAERRVEPAPVAAEPPARPPAALPADVATNLAQLDDRDPETRQLASTALMSLTRDDLPALRDVAVRQPSSVTLRAALHDVVTHVYLTGKHRFQGAVNGYLGVVAVPTLDVPPTVILRTIGYDAFRALRNGDVIVGIRLGGRGPAVADVPSMDTLVNALSRTRAGDRLMLRVLRDGTLTDVDMTLGPKPLNLDMTKGANPAYPEAEAYWRREFAPALDAAEDAAAKAAAATRPVGG